MTVIDINELDPSRVKSFRADGLSDAEILECANAPRVAQRIDDIPSSYRALFADGETDTEIIDWWNNGEPTPWRDMDLNTVPKAWLEWQLEWGGLSRDEIRELAFELGAEVPDDVVDLCETDFVNGKPCNSLILTRGEAHVFDVRYGADGKYYFHGAADSHDERVIMCLNWLNERALGAWAVNSHSHAGDYRNVVLHLEDAQDYLKACELLAVRA